MDDSSYINIFESILIILIKKKIIIILKIVILHLNIKTYVFTNMIYGFIQAPSWALSASWQLLAVKSLESNKYLV